LQLRGDLKGAAAKLQKVETEVKAVYAKARAELVKVTDHCGVQSGESATRQQLQEASITTLQATRNVQLEKQAQAEAELQGMQATMDSKVASYQQTVAQRANEATNFVSWTKGNDKYTKALEGVIDMMNKKEKQMGDTKGAGMARVKGVMEGMKQNVVVKKTEFSKKYQGQDADYLKLVGSYRKSLSDTQAAYTNKRVQKEVAQIAARDAGGERDVRQFINTGEESLLEIMIDICAKKSGKLQRTLVEGDGYLDSLKTQVTSTVGDMNGMPATFLQMPTGGDDLMKMAAEVEARQHRTFKAHHIRKATRKVLAVKIPQIKPTVPTSVPLKLSKGSTVKVNTTVVRAFDASLSHVASSHLVVAKHTVEGTPTTNAECVEEKRRISSDITVARAKKSEAETQKRLAQTMQKSYDAQINLVTNQEKKLTKASNGFSTAWLPLMTMIGTDSFKKDMTAALSKVDAVEVDVQAYIKSGGPPAASAVPTSLNNVRDSIKKLRDGVQADLAKLQSLFAGKLMVKYPAVKKELDTKATELNTKKAEVAKLVPKHTQEASLQATKIGQLDKEWDSAMKTCDPILKGKAR